MSVLTDESELVRSRATLLGPPGTWADPSAPAGVVPCLVDAVWSIANRRTTAQNVLTRYCALRARAGDDAANDTPMRLAIGIRTAGGAEAFAEVVSNRQRTSATGGVLRTEALRRLADVLADGGIDDRDDLCAADPERLESLRIGWTAVPGHRSGISWELFLLLLDAPRGPANVMTRRFVARALGRADTDGVTAEEAARLVEAVAADVGCPPRALELATWRYEMEGGDGLAEARRRRARSQQAAPDAPPASTGHRASSGVGVGPAPTARPGASKGDVVDVSTSPASKGPLDEALAARPAGGEPMSLDRGVAGASARREHERRGARQDARTRDRHPILGGLLVRTRDEPPNVRSWAKGAEGEETVGRRLDRIERPGLVVLHDRRIPGTRRNIDHLVVGPAGLWVVDTKKYAGRAEVTRSATGRTRLSIDGNDQSRLVEKLAGQVALITAAVARLDPGAPVHGALCMVETELPRIRTLEFGGFPLLRPKAVAQRVGAPGPLAERRVTNLVRAVAEEFVPA